MFKITIFVFLFTSIGAFAATSGTLTLEGTVAEELSMILTEITGHDALDLSTSYTDVKVAEVSESSNSATGYKITLDSTNDGNLVNATTSEQFPYALTYDGGTAVDLTTVPTVKTNTSTIVNNEISDIDITYTGKAATSMSAGTYSDTVLITISAI